MNFALYLTMILILVSPLIFLFFKRKKINSVLIVIWLLPVMVIQLIIFIIGVSYLNDYLTNNVFLFHILLVIYSLILLIIITLLFYVIFIDLTMISTNKNWNKLTTRKKLFFLVSSLVILILIPHILFALVYMISYGIYDFNMLFDSNLDFTDFLFLTFSIYYSIPLHDDSILNIIQQEFSKDIVLRVVEMIHIVASKIMEFVLIGYFITKAIDVISNLTERKIKRHYPSVAKELKELHQLKVNGAISNQEYDDLKKELLGKK